MQQIESPRFETSQPRDASLLAARRLDQALGVFLWTCLIAILVFAN